MFKKFFQDALLSLHKINIIAFAPPIHAGIGAMKIFVHIAQILRLGVLSQAPACSRIFSQAENPQKLGNRSFHDFQALEIHGTIVMEIKDFQAFEPRATDEWFKMSSFPSPFGLGNFACAQIFKVIL